MCLPMTGPIPARWVPYLQSVLRIVAAFSFTTHGTQKLFAVPVAAAREPVELVSLVGLAGVLEVLYCFIWLYLAAAGSGPWSLDALRLRAGGRP